MVVESKLEVKKIGREDVLLKSGAEERIVYRLNGYDTVNSVEWILTLKSSDEKMPAAYEKHLGTKSGQKTVLATIGVTEEQLKI